MTRTLSRPLVLGGAGFLGTWLVAKLREAGLSPTVIDNLSTGHHEGPTSDAFMVADLRDVDLAAVIAERQIDVVFHLATAAYVPPSVDDPVTDLEQNVTTTLHVLEAARRSSPPPLVVLASSAAVYGEAVDLPMAEDHPRRPTSPYGVAKLAAENYLDLYWRLHAVPGVAVRLFSLYGPGQRKQVVYDLMVRAMSGERPLTVLGSSQATRDFVYVEDAARAFVTLARAAPARGEVYNLAAGRPIAIADLASAIVGAVGVDVPVVFPGDARPGDPLHWHGDASAARSVGVELDTPLEQGLRLTAEWLRARRGDTQGTEPAP